MIPVAGYIVNVCNVSEGDINKLDKIVNRVLRKKDTMENKQVMKDYMDYEKKVVEN